MLCYFQTKSEKKAQGFWRDNYFKGEWQTLLWWVCWKPSYAKTSCKNVGVFVPLGCCARLFGRRTYQPTPCSIPEERNVLLQRDVCLKPKEICTIRVCSVHQRRKVPVMNMYVFCKQTQRKTVTATWGTKQAGMYLEYLRVYIYLFIYTHPIYIYI